MPLIKRRPVVAKETPNELPKEKPIAAVIQQIEVIPADVLVALLKDQQRLAQVMATALTESQKRPESIVFNVTARDSNDRISKAVLTPVYAKNG